jgi:hypothetical protein
MAINYIKGIFILHAMNFRNSDSDNYLKIVSKLIGLNIYYNNTVRKREIVCPQEENKSILHY